MDRLGGPRFGRPVAGVVFSPSAASVPISPWGLPASPTDWDSDDRLLDVTDAEQRRRAG